VHLTVPVAADCNRPLLTRYRSDFGFRPRANFCASAICARDLSNSALAAAAPSKPCAADRLNHMWARECWRTKCVAQFRPAAPFAEAGIGTVAASVAEREAGLVSERTKAALATAKARGVKLGIPNGARACVLQCACGRT
jgi:hypothetical protein